MAKAKASENPDLPPIFDPEDIRLLDPVWYTDTSKAIAKLVGKREISPLDADRYDTWLDSKCRKHLGMSIEEATRQQASAFERVTKDILETLPHDLDLLEKEYARTEELSEDVKKKCLKSLRRLKRLQREAREDPVKGWIYVMRDSEGDVPEDRRDSHGNGVFHPEWFHVAFFMAWGQTMYPRVLVMAPPGHGKTTCLRWYLADKIGRMPHRRFLGLYDKDDKPKREIPLVATILESGRYKAIFPSMKLLDRKDQQERSTRRFTVKRPNIFSREPTYEGFSIQSEFNGMGYDELICDDMCPPSVREHNYIRENIWGRFTSVAQERLRNPRTAQIKMIATPWHDSDAHGRIRMMVAKGQLTGWLVLADCFAIKDDAHGQAEPLWSRFDTAVLEQKKAIMGTRYDCNYRLKASTEQMRTLRRMWFYNALPNGQFTTKRDLEMMAMMENCERWLSIDPSATQASWSSDQGVTEWVFSPQGFLFCTQVWFLHLGAVPMQDWLIRRLYNAAGNGYEGLYIEAQGGMRGQCNLWVQGITDALTSGQIPVGEGDERKVVQMEPYQRPMPRWTMTGTRMGGSMQNMSKVKRLRECAHFIENRWVRFAGQRVMHSQMKDTTYCRAVTNSPMERLQNTMFTFDGTNNSDAVDSVTQFLLGMKHKMKNPNVVTTPEKTMTFVDPTAKAFHAALAGVERRLKDGQDPEQQEKVFYENAWVA